MICSGQVRLHRAMSCHSPEKGEVLLRGVGILRYVFILGKTRIVKCPSVQWQPDGLTIRTKK